MLWFFENINCFSAFNNTSSIHNHNCITHSSYNAQGVCNHNNCGSKTLCQILHQFKDLCRNCNIKSRSWLICNKDFRIARKPHSNHNPLTHSTRKLMWITVNTFCSCWNTCKSKHFNSFFSSCFFVQTLVKLNCFYHLSRDFQKWIQT